MTGITEIPRPGNEPVLTYGPGTPERARIKAQLDEMLSTEIEIPLIIGGEDIRTGNTREVTLPHDHGHVLAHCHQAGDEEIGQAVRAARKAWKEWGSWPWKERAAVFLRAADLLASKWRAKLNAATMLGQSKTVHQAEIDSACELADFFRFNVYFAQGIYEDQPRSASGVWNRMEYRPLEGFVYAITPFNFTSIGGNLPSAPAIMGNTVIWKPSSTAVYSSYYIARLFQEAGLPAGVINFLPGPSATISDVLLGDPHLAGIHFTGSTSVFQGFWRTVGENIASYKGYPRLVGETGGKNFILAHTSADTRALVTAIVRGGYEYQGQKCSAASRVYVPESLWAEVGGALIEEIEGLAMGDPLDFTNFMSAVIDRKAFDKITRYVEDARASDTAEVLAGGEWDDRKGYFIRPTLIRAHDPRHVCMCEEIFGPVVTLYVYDDDAWAETLELVDTTSPYALTGAVFARNRDAIQQAQEALRYAAGNFYVNDKPTGAVVGQQPFGGARASGTNDKAGSPLNLLRWVSARSVKENFVPPTDYRYPFMNES